MATRLSHRRWLLRDVPHLGALSVWALAGFAVLVYCFDRPAVERMFSIKWRFSALTQSDQQGSSGNAPGQGQAIYTGSILFVPARGELCGQWMFDNRNGAFWDNGQVSCRPANGVKPEEITSAARMIAIGKAFKGD